MVIRRPTTRFAYWTGIRRWPSWTKTMPTITANATNGIITMKTWSGFVHQDEIPGPIPAAIDAKIISEIPLPIPRWVINSPSHINSVVPAVSEITIRNTLPKVRSPTTLVPSAFWKLSNRNT